MKAGYSLSNWRRNRGTLKRRMGLRNGWMKDGGQVSGPARAKLLSYVHPSCLKS